MQRPTVLKIGSALQVIAVALITLITAPAAAQRLVLELNVGDSRPAQVEQVMIRLRSVLPFESIATPEAIRTKLAAHVWRPGLVDSALTNEAFATEINSGSRAFSNGEFAKAQKTLEAALSRARDNPLVLVREMKNRQTMLRGLVSLALANKRIHETSTGSAKAGAAEKRDATMKEVIRSYPEQAISYKSFGREAESLFLSVSRELALQGQGSLQIVVRANEPLTVYLNEVKRDIRRPLIGLAPGVYRVLVQTSAGAAREYRTEIFADRATNMVIDWDLDAALRVGDWAGFQFATEAARVVEGKLIAALLRGRRDITEVATFRVFINFGQVTVVASLYRAAGEEIRHGKVEWNDAEPYMAKLVQLVKSLDENTPGVSERVLTPATQQNVAAASTADRHQGQGSHLGAKLLVVGGVSTMIGGGIMIAIDEDPVTGNGPVKPTYLDTGLPGAVILSAGALLTGVGLWFWLRDDAAPTHHARTRSRPRSVPVFAVTQDQIFLGWTGAL